MDVERTLRNACINSIEPNRSAERSEVRHSIRARCSRQAKATVEQTIPNRHSRFVIAEAEHLDVIHLAKRSIDGQLVRQPNIFCGIRKRVVRMNVYDQRMLFVGPI